MIFHLYGPDSYCRNKRLREFLAEYLKKYEAADLLDLDFTEDAEATAKAKDFLSQPSMFTPSKVLVARESATSVYPVRTSKKSSTNNEDNSSPAKKGSNGADNKDWAGILKKFIDEPKTFIFLSDAGKPVKAFDFLLKKPVHSIQFDELAGADLQKFIVEEAAARGLKFAPDALRYFVNFASSAKDESWNAVNEIEKLSLIDLPQPTTLKAIEAVIEWTAKAAVFEGTRAIIWGRGRAEKLKALEKLFLQKEAAAYIFNSLGFGARGRDTVRLADYDVSIKSGGLEYEEALLDFVLRP